MKNGEKKRRQRRRSYQKMILTKNTILYFGDKAVPSSSSRRMSSGHSSVIHVVLWLGSQKMQDHKQSWSCVGSSSNGNIDETPWRRSRRGRGDLLLLSSCSLLSHTICLVEAVCILCCAGGSGWSFEQIGVLLGGEDALLFLRGSNSPFLSALCHTGKYSQR